MAKPLSRVSFCPECNGPVQIAFEYWQPGFLAQDVTWVCPLCGTTINLGIVGRVVSVAARNPQSLLIS